MKKGLIACFIALFAVAANAAVVTGTVKDANGEPLIGVSVAVSGTSNGTITDLDGNFSLDVQANDQLVFSYVGYTEVRETVGNRKTITVTLSEDRKVLDEVVVVGYGTQKKANLTGAVANVNVEKELTGRPIVNIGQGLQGTTPGLTITNESGKLGATPEFRIRGAIGSLSGGSSAPLILLNGSEISDISLINPDDVESISVLKDASSSSIYGSRATFGVILITTKTGKGVKDKFTLSYNNNFSWSGPTYTYNQMNMSDWYKMNMIMYGGNGTTWGGAVCNQQAYEGALKFEQQYGDGSGLSDEMILGRDFDLLDDGTFLQYRKWNVMDKYLSKKAFGQSHNISVDGNTGKANFHLGLGYMGQDGMFTINKRHMDRYNLNFATTIDVNKWVKVKTELIYSHSDLTAPYAWNAYRGNGYADNELAYVLWFPYHPQGTYTITEADLAKSAYLKANYSDMVGKTLSFNNGATQQSAGYTAKTMKDYMKATVGATFVLGIPDLTLDIDYSFNYNTENVKGSGGPTDPYWNTWAGKLQYAANYASDVDSRINESQASERYHIGNAVLRYHHVWNQKHDFSVMVGANIESKNYRFLSTIAGNKESVSHEEQSLVDGSYYNVTSSHDELTYRNVGVFARINYAYDNRYLIELNGRADGSSKFQKGHKWGFFPSGSIGWVASSEKFWEALDPWWSFAKLRASYGAVGNQNIDANLYRQLLTKSKSMWVYNGQIQQAYGLPTTIRESFTWENVKTVDAGFDFRFFHDDLGISFDWYQRNTDGMIVDGAELPATFGANAPKENAGNLRTRGWELQLDYHHRFDFGLGINFVAGLSDARTKVMKYANRTESSTISMADRYYEGGEFGDIWGFKVERLYQQDDFNADGTMRAGLPSTEELEKDGGVSFEAGDVKYADLDGDGKISWGDKTYKNHGDLTVIGNSTPRYEYNFKLGLDYFGFDVNLFFQGVGKKDYWATGYIAIPGYYEGGGFFLKEHLDYWTPENPNARWPRLMNFGDGNADLSKASHNYIPNDRYMLNMAYCRLKNVTIGYSLPKKALDKMHFQKFRVYFTMENIATIDHMNGLPIDPETGDNAEDTCWGMGWGQVSSFPKTFSCGLQITF